MPEWDKPFSPGRLTEPIVRIVLDLDNTIISYDDVFATVARERGLVGEDCPSGKQAVRDAIRSRIDGEAAWQLLQADVYGDLIGRAVAFAGAREFIERARARSDHVVVVSHKSAFATARPHGINLRDAACGWLQANDFIGSDGLAMTDVFFEDSRRQKIDRIASLDAHVVIDDLVEVLRDSRFPIGPRRWLFVPGGPELIEDVVESFGSWPAMSEALAR